MNRRVMPVEAEAIGLVTHVVDDDVLLHEGAALARRLREAPVAAIGAARGLLRQSFESSLLNQLDREFGTMMEAGAAEGQEGSPPSKRKDRPFSSHSERRELRVRSERQILCGNCI